MDDNKITISQLINALINLREWKGDLPVRALDEYGELRYDVVLNCTGDELIITSGPQM